MMEFVLSEKVAAASLVISVVGGKLCKGVFIPKLCVLSTIVLITFLAKIWHICFYSIFREATCLWPLGEGVPIIEVGQQMRPVLLYDSVSKRRMPSRTIVIVNRLLNKKRQNFRRLLGGLCKR
jgi:hypothetical protein